MTIERPSDNTIMPIAEALGWQRRYVIEAGSPVAARILDAVMHTLEEGGLLREVLPTQVRFGDLMGLRVMAAVHRLALERRASAVALHLPTLGGLAPAPDQEEDFAKAVVDALEGHPDELRASINQTPQTNEVGRAALLRCALSRLGPDAEVRLNEIGCSAGLNLRADRLPGQDGLESGPLPTVVERRGCDLDPVDPATQEGRIHLSSYIWVDDVVRFQRLGRALAVAAEVPATVVRRDAVTFLEELSVPDSATTVVWHSAMWPYLQDDEKSAILAAIARLGRSAGPGRPFVHVSWEWSLERADLVRGFELVVRQWTGHSDDGRPVRLARARGHGDGASLVSPAGEPLDAEPLDG